jgi:hypothetical protein
VGHQQRNVSVLHDKDTLSIQHALKIKTGLIPGNWLRTKPCEGPAGSVPSLSFVSARTIPTCGLWSLNVSSLLSGLAPSGIEVQCRHWLAPICL